MILNAISYSLTTISDAWNFFAQITHIKYDQRVHTHHVVVWTTKTGESNRLSWWKSHEVLTNSGKVRVFQKLQLSKFSISYVSSTPMKVLADAEPSRCPKTLKLNEPRRQESFLFSIFWLKKGCSKKVSAVGICFFLQRPMLHRKKNTKNNRILLWKTSRYCYQKLDQRLY